MSFICNYCSTNLESRSSLNYHIRNTEFCLNLQGKKKEKYECNYCNHFFSTKYSLEKHKNVCKIYNEEINNLKLKLKKQQEDKIINNFELKLNKQQEEYESQLKKQQEAYEERLLKQEEKYEVKINVLVDKLDALATKGIEKTTINNNINNKTIYNIFPSQKEIDQKIECQFTDTYVQYGIKGVAKFLYDKVFKLEDDSLVYNCVDVARHIFKFKDKDGNEIKDHKATKLIKMIKPGIFTQSKTVYDFVNRECDDLEKTKDYGSDDKKKYDNMIELRKQLYEGNLDISSIDQNGKLCLELMSLTCK